MAQNNTPTRNVARDVEMLFAAGMGSPVTPLGFTAPLGLLPMLAWTTPAFNATYVADPSLAVVHEMTLTGGVTPGAPARADGTAVQKGTLLIYKWIQDGVGGRAMTYSNAIFKATGGAAQVTTLSTVTFDVFLYDGTNWRLVWRLAGQTV